MNAHADRSHLTHLKRVAAWVGTKLQARRARRLEEETVACLRSMDSKLLNDIGVGIDDLSGKPPQGEAEDPLRPFRHSYRRTQS